MSSVLTVVVGIGVGACASSEEETPESAAHAQSSPIAPPVDRPDRPFAGGPFNPAAQLPRTPIIIPDGPVQRFQLGSTTVEITRVNAGADRKVSQPEAGVMCGRLNYAGKTGWYLPDEQTLLALVGKVGISAEVWSNVDYVQASGFTTVDPTTGATDLRQMASTIDLETGDFVERDHQFSYLGSKSDFVCIHTETRIPDWRSCLPEPQPVRCMCLGAWFVPPRQAFECN